MNKNIRIVILFIFSFGFLNQSLIFGQVKSDSTLNERIISDSINQIDYLNKEKIDTTNNNLSKEDKALEKSLQQKINLASKIFDEYYKKKHQIKILNKKEKKIKKQLELNLDDLNSINKDYEKIECEISSINDSLSTYRKEIKIILKKEKKIDSLQFRNDTSKIKLKILHFNSDSSKALTKKKTTETNLKRIETIINDKNNEISFLNKQKDEIDLEEQKFLDSKLTLKDAFKDSTGDFSFSFKSQKYFAFIFDFKLHEIKFHLNYRNSKDHKAQKYIQLKNLKDHLEETHKKNVLMLTNAGMYTPRNNAEGLLIADSIELEPIDLENPNKMLNFYLMPNGIFYIDDEKGYIEETETFNKKYKNKEISPEQATQSGPMLVINGSHHPAFNHGSNSKKLRSGVGILPDGRLVFIISNRSVTNFHDFSTIFKDVFGCENALFLDGVISKMYLKKINPKALGGNLGPMISVCEK